MINFTKTLSISIKKDLLEFVSFYFSTQYNIYLYFYKILIFSYLKLCNLLIISFVELYVVLTIFIQISLIFLLAYGNLVEK